MLLGAMGVIRDARHGGPRLYPMEHWSFFCLTKTFLNGLRNDQSLNRCKYVIVKSPH